MVFPPSQGHNWSFSTALPWAAFPETQGTMRGSWQTGGEGDGRREWLASADSTSGNRGGLIHALLHLFSKSRLSPTERQALYLGAGGVSQTDMVPALMELPF